MTFFVGAAIHHEVKNDFTYSGESFLMGTVALGMYMKPSRHLLWSPF